MQFDRGSKCWLFMMFLGYAFLYIVRVHFLYVMMSLLDGRSPAGHGGQCEATVLPTAESTANSTAATAAALVPADWTPKQQTAVTSAYFVGTLLSAFPGGVYTNRGHELTVMLLCITVTTVTVLLMPVATGSLGSWVAVLALRFVQGCAFGPAGSCGGMMAKKIIPKPVRSTYSTYMFSGTVFGCFLANIFSGVAMPIVSATGSLYALSALGCVWVVVWTTMIHVTRYNTENDADAVDRITSAHSMTFSTTPWTVIFGSKPFISLLVASCGYGYLFSSLVSVLPVYRSTMLGGGFVENGVTVSIPWLTCWITCVLAGLCAVSLTNAGYITRTVIIKLYAALILIASPLMLLGVMIAECDQSTAKLFMFLAVVFFSFERSSIRINSLDLCSRYAGSLIALCDVFNSMGNISNLVIFRILFPNTVIWTKSLIVSITFPIVCCIPYIFFASSKNQCWDQRYLRPMT